MAQIMICYGTNSPFCVNFLFVCLFVFFLLLFPVLSFNLLSIHFFIFFPLLLFHSSSSITTQSPLLHYHHLQPSSTATFHCPLLFSPLSPRPSLATSSFPLPFSHLLPSFSLPLSLSFLARKRRREKKVEEGREKKVEVIDSSGGWRKMMVGKWRR